jgi:hypothetical protein
MLMSKSRWFRLFGASSKVPVIRSPSCNERTKEQSAITSTEALPEAYVDSDRLLRVEYGLLRKERRQSETRVKRQAGAYLPMRVLGVGTGAKLDGLVACIKRAVEPTEESVDVCTVGRMSTNEDETCKSGVQSDRSAFRSNGTLKAKSSTVTVFKSMC